MATMQHIESITLRQIETVPAILLVTHLSLSDSSGEKKTNVDWDSDYKQEAMQLHRFLSKHFCIRTLEELHALLPASRTVVKLPARDTADCDIL